MKCRDTTEPRCGACDNKKTFSTRWNLKTHMRAVHRVDVDIASIMETDVNEAEMAKFIGFKKGSKSAKNYSKRAKNHTKLLKKDSKRAKNDFKTDNLDISQMPTVKIKEEVPDAKPSSIFGNVTFHSEDGKECTKMTETHLRRQQISQLLEMEVPPWKIAQV